MPEEVTSPSRTAFLRMGCRRDPAVPGGEVGAMLVSGEETGNHRVWVAGDGTAKMCCTINR